MNTSSSLRFRTVLALAVLMAFPLANALAQEGPKKVSKNEGLNALTTKVAPDYPAIARQLKIEGGVELEAVVSESGAVEKVTILSGNPVLTRPASEAIKKWKYAPFTSEGKATKALVPISLSFKL